MSITDEYPCDPSRQDAFEEGRASCDSEVDALKFENERLKVWNEALECTFSERGKQVDRHLAELAALRNRLHVAEDSGKTLAESIRGALSTTACCCDPISGTRCPKCKAIFALRAYEDSAKGGE